MHRRIAIVGAPSSIGIRPYDSGEARQLDRAPGVLRELGLVKGLGASDLGDVIPLAYRDYVRPPGGVRNETEVTSYCRTLSERVAAATSDGRFAVVLGGDCSIVLGCLMGARQSARGSVGLAYFDAHPDFGTPEESRTGSAASMCLALAVGRGETPLARLAGNELLVHGRPTIKELVELLTALVRHPRALGLELTIYDPGLDPDRSCAARLVKLLENLLLGSGLIGERSH